MSAFFAAARRGFSQSRQKKFGHDVPFQFSKCEARFLAAKAFAHLLT